MNMIWTEENGSFGGRRQGLEGRSLAGYVAVAGLAAGLMTVGCRKAPAADDPSLNAAVQQRLQADTGLSGQPLQATVQGGVATLSGSVDSAAARSLAANDTAGVPGIREVINNLTLAAPTTAPVAVVTPTPAPIRTIPEHSQARLPERPIERQQQAPIDRHPPQYAQNQQPEPPIVRQAAAPPPPPAVRNVTVPAGTGLSVRITQTLDSQSTQPGTTFSGVLASDVIVDDLVAFPAGTRVNGRVDDAKDAGHFSGNSLLAISLTGINRRGESIPISTDSFSKQGNGRGKNTAEKVGGGAAVGAILGGILGGGKGAAIGAGAGGGLGAGANGVTRGQQVQIPSESLVRFRLNTPVTVRAAASGEGNNGGLQSHEN